MLAKHGSAPSAEEIDENRKDMFHGFGEHFQMIAAVADTHTARSLSLVEAFYRSRLRCVGNLDPGRRIGDPAPDGQRRTFVSQFRLHNGRQDDGFSQAWKKVNVFDEDKVVDRAGVGDHQPHGSETQALEGGAFLLKIFHGVVFVDAMGLEEAVKLNARQSKHAA